MDVHTGEGDDVLRSTQAPRAARPLLLLAALAAVALLLSGCLTPAQQEDFDLVNAARKANSKKALTVDMAAVKKAQAWSERMARTGVLEHTGGGSKLDPSGLTDFCGLSENVGKGRSVAAVHEAFMNSATHKANILGNYHRVGTGVHKSGSTYWVTEIFLRAC